MLGVQHHGGHGLPRPAAHRHHRGGRRLGGRRPPARAHGRCGGVLPVRRVALGDPAGGRAPARSVASPTARSARSRCSRCSPTSARSPRWACTSSTASATCSAAGCSCSPTSRSAQRWWSTTRSCPRSPRPTTGTRCPPAGWAFGYLGGGLLLALNLALYVVSGRDRHQRRARGPDQHPVGRACGGPCSRWSRCAPAHRGARRSPTTRASRSSPAASASSLTTLREIRRVPADAAVPGRLPAVQRRHPDRDRAVGDVRQRGARARPADADRGDPGRAVRRVRRRAAVRAPRAAVRRKARRAGQSGRVDRRGRGGVLPAGRRERCRSSRSRSASGSCSAAARRCRGRCSRR